MSPTTSKYKAYSAATRTVAKTRQVVMLYDGAIRFLKQALHAIEEKRIEDRYKLLSKAAEIMVGLQSSIDFDNGGKIANVLHGFYTHVSRRIILLNCNKNWEDAKNQCAEIISELKQMRDTWDSIDHSVGVKEDNAAATSSDSSAGNNTVLSA